MISTPSAAVQEHRWATGALLGLLGLLLNQFSISLTPGIDLLFGGIAYLLAAVALGPGPGLLAAAIASVQTVWLWNHPYAWLIFGLEGLAVGYLATRWGRRPLTADAVYWVVLGVPLLFLTYYLLMGVRGTTATIIFLKQPFNGLINALGAEALLLLPWVRQTLRIGTGPRLRSAIAVVLALAAVVPALVFGVWAGRREWERSMELARDRVEFGARAYASKLQQYLELHQQSVISVARGVETRPDLSPERLLRLIAAEHGQFPGFREMYVTDVRGSVLAIHPEREEDRDDLRFEPGERGPFPSRPTVIREVLGDQDGAGPPVLLIAHPIELADTLAGYVVGALDLNQLPEPVATRGSAERVRVANSEGILVFDSRQPYTREDTLRRVPDATAFATARAEARSGVTVYREMGPTTAASRVAAQVLMGYAPLPTLGWWIWVEHPFRQVAASAATPYARLMGLLVALMFVAGLFSTLLSGALAAPLLRLRGAAAALAAGDLGARVRTLPVGVPQEIADLGRGFDEMADTLAGRAEELEQLSEIARSLASTLDIDELLRQITNATARLVDADGCGVALVHPDSETLRVGEYSLGLLASAAGHELPLDASLSGWVVRTGQSALVPDIDHDERIFRSHVDAEQIRSVMSAPLVGRSGVLGSLNAVRARVRGRSFTYGDLRLLERLAQHAAIAVENARLYETAQTASHAKSDFIATMSHELRTPLNAMLGHLELLQMGIHGAMNEAQENALGRIEAALRHLRGLIEEVLSFSRIEAGRVSVRWEETDLCELIEEVSVVIEPLTRGRELALRIEGCATPERVRTDPDKVRQILLNLAGNAVKFTERGEVRIGIESREADVVLAVADTGPGIAEEDRDRLFRPFEQLEGGLARQHGGTGLGLYLSGRYAELIGGRIEVSSEPGRGSVFSLILPREREAGRGNGEEGTATTGALVESGASGNAPLSTNPGTTVSRRGDGRPG